MNNIIIIGISGKKQSGKDTIANYLVDNYDFIKLSFGDNVKKALQNIFHFSNEQLWGNKKEENDDNWDLVPRDIMQFFGTDLMRDKLSEKYPQIGKNIWIKSIEFELNNYISNGFTKFVIPDIRFENEIEYIKKKNGIIINVFRKQKEKIYN
jgi:hypothetical protein